MKIAYISGPYRAETHNGVRRNILRAEAVAMKYWRLGYGVICPHKNCSMIDEGEELADIIMEADLEMERRCADVVVMVPEWNVCSSGSAKEHALALELGLEIIYETEETIQEYLGEIGRV